MDTIKIINRLKEDPNSIIKIEPALFEAVVAELLAGFGWQVSVTPPTRDGGYDVIAISVDASGLETHDSTPRQRSGRSGRGHRPV